MYQRAAHTIHQATANMTTATDPQLAATIVEIADILHALARAWEGDRGGPLTDAADLLDRAAHDHHHRHPGRRGSRAAHLRTMARSIGLSGAVSHDQDRKAALHLIYAVAALADTLGDLRDAQQRLHQTQAARAAATQLRAYNPPPLTPTVARVRPDTTMGRQPMVGRRPAPPHR